MYLYVLGILYGTRLRMEVYKSVLLRKKIAFLLGTATYGNIGDLAISRSSEEYIHRNFSSYTVISVTAYIADKNRHYLSRVIRDSDLVFIQGGGNFGDIYPDIEIERRRLLKSIRGHKIVMLPTSFNVDGNFDQSDYADVSFAIRESKSMTSAIQKMGNYNKLLLVPDIVLSLNVNKKALDTSGGIKSVGLVIRDDKEKQENAALNTLMQMMDSEKLSINKFDTTFSTRGIFSKKLRNNVINQLLEKIKSNDLIVTDRLHGMILSVVVGVPVVVFDNSTNKILHTVKDWLSDNAAIYYVAEGEKITHKKIEIWYNSLCDKDFNLNHLTESYGQLNKFILDSNA